MYSGTKFEANNHKEGFIGLRITQVLDEKGLVAPEPGRHKTTPFIGYTIHLAVRVVKKNFSGRGIVLEVRRGGHESRT